MSTIGPITGNAKAPRRGAFFPPNITAALDLTDRQAAEDWIDRNQLGRRNLSPDTASLLRGRIYNRTKKQGRRTDLTSPHFEEKSAAGLATNYGVSKATIERDGQFARAVEVVKQADPTIEQRVHSGKVAKQSVVAAAELEPFFAEDAKRRQKLSIKARDEKGRAAPVMAILPQVVQEKPAPVARNEAAKSVGVGERYVQDAKKIRTEAPEVFERLKAGKMTLQDAKREVANTTGKAVVV